MNIHLVDLRELDALLWRAAPPDGGNVEHSIPELDECPPAGTDNTEAWLTGPETLTHNAVWF